MVELAAIFRLHGPASRARFGHRMPTSPLAAMQAIEQCRTEALGGPVYQCSECGELKSSEHACQNRHGPKCQNHEATRWLHTPRQLLLPVPSFLVPFPRPAARRPVARSHQKRLYHLLLHTSAAALQALALAPTHLGGQIGLRGVRHTWTRALASPPHVHSLVPGGALAPDGSTWLSPRSDNWLVPGRARSTICRGKCKQALAQAALLDDVPTSLWHKPWVPPCQPAGPGPEVFTSFAPSIRRSAITNNRIDKLEDGYVTCRFKESQSNAWQRRTLPAQECIRRFLPHGLPQGCITVRYSGFLSPSCRKALPHIRELLAPSSCPVPAPHDRTTRHPHPPPPTTQPARQCPPCRGPRVLIRHLSRPPRAPPCAHATSEVLWHSRLHQACLPRAAPPDRRPVACASHSRRLGAQEPSLPRSIPL